MSAKTWNVVESDFPATGSARQKLGYVLKCAARTVVQEEWQPWQYRLTEGHIELCAQMSAAAEAVDPEGRELMIRCGTALFHLKLVMKHFGCLGRVDLFPDLDEAELVARIYCGFVHEQTADEVALFEAMTRSSTPFARSGAPPIHKALQEKLSPAVAGEKAWLEFSQCESSRQRLLKFTQSSPCQKSSRFGSAGIGPGKSRIVQWTKPLLNIAMRTTGSGTSALAATASPEEQVSALAVLKTKTDDKHGWLATGETRARVQLQARLSHVPSYVYDRAFQSRQVRNELRTAIGHKGFVQAVLGFGSHAAQWTFTLPSQLTATATLP